MASAQINDHIRYEPEEKCSILSSLVVGIQGVILTLPILFSIGAITVLATGRNENYLGWAVFASLIVVAIVTALQTSRLGRMGAGHLVIMGLTPNYIAPATLALAGGAQRCWQA